MYLPRYHQAKDPTTLLNLIDEHPLGAWVCTGTEGLIANHIPFVLDRSRGPHGTLIGHVSRANAVWRDLHPTAASVVMFQGPQAYISPSWYPGKTAHGEVVPTWDYVVAHAHGVARAIDDRDWLLAMLERLTETQESTGCCAPSWASKSRSSDWRANTSLAKTKPWPTLGGKKL